MMLDFYRGADYVFGGVSAHRSWAISMHKINEGGFPSRGVKATSSIRRRPFEGWMARSSFYVRVDCRVWQLFPFKKYFMADRNACRLFIGAVPTSWAMVFGVTDSLAKARPAAGISSFISISPAVAAICVGIWWRSGGGGFERQSSLEHSPPFIPAWRFGYCTDIFRTILWPRGRPARRLAVRHDELAHTGD